MGAVSLSLKYFEREQGNRLRRLDKFYFVRNGPAYLPNHLLTMAAISFLPISGAPAVCLPDDIRTAVIH